MSSFLVRFAKYPCPILFNSEISILQGNQFYCLSVAMSHISCQLASVEPPSYCWLRSEPVFVAAIPAIGRLIPMCRSHLACAWFYITVAGTMLLLFSLLLACLCVRGCDHHRCRKSHATDEVQ
jgi:hypothetical protein